MAEAGKQGADGLPVLNQAGQHWNHCLFWQVMSPKGGGEKLPQRLQAKIDQDLGGFPQFKEAFKQAGVTQFGSGWAWLAIGADGKLKVTKTPNGANPLSTGEGQPILGCDVWEHAYYLDFRNRAAELPRQLPGQAGGLGEGGRVPLVGRHEVRPERLRRRATAPGSAARRRRCFSPSRSRSSRPSRPA